MKEIVFATNNTHKLSELRGIVGSRVKILSLADIGCHEDIPETGTTLEENSAQKVQFIASRYGRDCFADDTGLFVEALGGLPGVHTARFAGEHATSDDNVDLLLSRLEGEANRKAYFKTVVSIISNGELHQFEGRIDGEITTERIGTNGFGYDPVFRPDGYDKTFAQLGVDVKNRISHRAIASRKLVDWIERNYADAEMRRVLFHSTIFGPIHSRRLGTSLGINLLPDDGKMCSFDCVYCEAGWNAQGCGTTGLPPRAKVAEMLEEKLRQMADDDEHLDVITFSGNGEPTLHPDFAGIIADVISLRDFFAPEAKVSVLSNATFAARESVAQALRRVDNNILKLDSAITSTLRKINRPNSPSFTAEKAIENCKAFAGQCIVQTLLLRGEWAGEHFDNTTDEEISALINAYRVIKPQGVMLYSIDRATPAPDLVKVTSEEIAAIAARVTTAGIKVF